MITHRHVSNHSHAAAGTLGNILYLLAKAGQYGLTWYLGEDRGAALAHVPVGPHTGEGGGCRTMPARSLHSVVHLHSDLSGVRPEVVSWVSHHKGKCHGCV